MFNDIRKHVHESLEAQSHRKRITHFIQWFIVVLIALNILAVMVDSIDSIWQQYSRILYGFEVVSVAIFTVEYLLRIWSCVEDEQWKHPVIGRLKYATSPMVLIDLVAILPFYFPLVFHIDLRFIRAVRLTRIFRVLKLGRHSDALQMFGRVIKAKRNEFAVTAIVVFILVTIASSLVYFAEHEAQPKAFASIPHAMWWAVMTLSTVGYGDIYPITPSGRFLAALVALLGVALFAMPTAILASGFMAEMQSKHKKDFVCPHCGETIDAANEASRNG